MKRRKREKVSKVLSFILAFTLILVLTACGSTEQADNVSDNASDTTVATAGDSDSVRTIKISSGSINPPYCYANEDGELEGFEYALLDEIQKLLPQYKFEVEDLPFQDVLNSVSAGKAQMAAWQFEKSPEREENYLFTEESYSDQKLYLTVYVENNEVNSLADLQDATVNGGNGPEFGYHFLEEYIAEHPEQNINLISSPNNLDEAGIEAIKNGSTTAVLTDNVTVAQKNRQLGEEVLKPVGDPVHEGYAYYVFQKGEEQLRDDFDEALRELKANGKLAELQQEWLGVVSDELKAGAGGDASKGDDSQETSSGEVRNIKIASGGIAPPYCYTNDDGELEGFEYALLDEIQKLLPQYKLEYEALEFKDVLTAVGAGKAQIAAWEFEKTPEREETFLFGEEPYLNLKTYLTVYAGNDDVKTLADLQDVTVNGGNISQTSYIFFEEYIKAYPEQNINLISTPNAYDEAGIEAIKNGATTATLTNLVNTVQKNKQLGEEVLKAVGDPVYESDAYYVFSKDEKQLRDDFDDALRQLKANGKLGELQEEWLGVNLDE